MFRFGGQVVSVLSLRVEGDGRPVYIMINAGKRVRRAVMEVE